MEIRPIDANALQELCNRGIQNMWNTGVAPVSWAAAYADFKNDIDSIPTLTPPNEWISVEERLPESIVNKVLVYREAAKRLTDAGVLLMQGDCLELLKDIPGDSVDMVLTDPPYGIDYQSQRKKDKSEWMPKIKNDKRPFIDFIPLIKRILKPTGCVMVFTRWDVQQKFIDEMNDSGLKVKNVLIWDKEIHGMGDLKRAFASRYESIIFHSERGFEFNGKRPQDIIKCRRVLPNELKHPNEKPVRLMEELICKCTHKGAVVLDLFMGSGTTGVACVNTGRKFIGMELDPGYFEAAKQRIEEAQAQARLAWNNRAPILSSREMEMLEGME